MRGLICVYRVENQQLPNFTVDPSLVLSAYSDGANQLGVLFRLYLSLVHLILPTRYNNDRDQGDSSDLFHRLSRYVSLSGSRGVRIDRWDRLLELTCFFAGAVCTLFRQSAISLTVLGKDKYHTWFIETIAGRLQGCARQE
jgi:hypothetical protein